MLGNIKELSFCWPLVKTLNANEGLSSGAGTASLGVLFSLAKGSELQLTKAYRISWFLFRMI